MEAGHHEVPSSVYEEVLTRHYRNNPGSHGKPDFRQIASILSRMTPDILALMKISGIEIPDNAIDIAKIIAGKFNLV